MTMLDAWIVCGLSAVRGEGVYLPTGIFRGQLSFRLTRKPIRSDCPLRRQRNGILRRTPTLCGLLTVAVTRERRLSASGYRRQRIRDPVLSRLTAFDPKAKVTGQKTASKKPPQVKDTNPAEGGE